MFSVPLALPAVVTAVLQTNRDRARGRSASPSRSPPPGPLLPIRKPEAATGSLSRASEAGFALPCVPHPTVPQWKAMFFVPPSLTLKDVTCLQPSLLFLGKIRRRKFEMPPSWEISVLDGEDDVISRPPLRILGTPWRRH